MMQKMMPVMMREMIPERKSRCFRLLFRQMPIQVLLFDMVLIITPLFYYSEKKNGGFFLKISDILLYLCYQNETPQ